ncbi:MAG: hypothetical protein ACM34M_04500 [Ignavibacteria bacterium]
MDKIWKDYISNRGEHQWIIMAKQRNIHLKLDVLHKVLYNDGYPDKEKLRAYIFRFTG